LAQGHNEQDPERFPSILEVAAARTKCRLRWVLKPIAALVPKILCGSGRMTEKPPHSRRPTTQQTERRRAQQGARRLEREAVDREHRVYLTAKLDRAWSCLTRLRWPSLRGRRIRRRFKGFRRGPRRRSDPGPQSCTSTGTSRSDASLRLRGWQGAAGACIEMHPSRKRTLYAP